MRAVVVALGKMGLPVAAKLTLAGHDVVGADIDPTIVGQVNGGRSPFPNEIGLDEAIAAAVAERRLRAVSDAAEAIAVHDPELIIAIPPLHVDVRAQPTWEALDAAATSIGCGLAATRSNADLPTRQPVIVIETTVPVGTTRTRLTPLIERASGLKAGRDLHVAFSPERVFSGRTLADLDAYPKLVGGLTPDGEERAAALYRQFLAAEVRTLGSAEAAELTKLAETTYRDINIAFANELARYSDRLGVDVLAIIDAANSQPYSHIHRPGIAVGGHCIPVYPRFLLAGDPDSSLPRLARAVNDAMPSYAAALLGDDLHGRTVLVLGVSYRGGIRETAFSGALALREVLAARGANVLASDPLYSADELTTLGFTPWDGVTAIDGAIVQADHPEYRVLKPEDLPGVETIVDGRGVLETAAFAAAGVTVKQIGRPTGVRRDVGSPIAPSASALSSRPV